MAGDNEMVALLSMVSFPESPSTWRGFRVLGISRPMREPYPVPALRQKVTDAEQRRDEQFDAFGEFRRRSYDDLASIQRLLRDDPDAPLGGHLLELHLEWEAYREERRKAVEGLHRAQLELEWELRSVTKSLQRESTPEYLSGEVVHEQARVQVSTGPSAATGPAGDRVYVVVLTRYELRNQFGAVVPARWIVTEIFSETL
jgi:hypothetical protein